jgi:hypothetical protein
MDKFFKSASGRIKIDGVVYTHYNTEPSLYQKENGLFSYSYLNLRSFTLMVGLMGTLSAQLGVTHFGITLS